MNSKAVDLDSYDVTNAKLHLVNFDPCNFLECRLGRYCSAVAAEQFLAYNFALTFRPPKLISSCFLENNYQSIRANRPKLRCDFGKSH